MMRHLRDQQDQQAHHQTHHQTHHLRAGSDRPGARFAVALAVGDLRAGPAIDETVNLLHPPLPLVGVSIVMERERQQNDSLVNG